MQRDINFTVCAVARHSDSDLVYIFPMKAYRVLHGQLHEDRTFHLRWPLYDGTGKRSDAGSSFIVKRDD